MKFFKKMKKNQKGFTLIELIVVIAIIGVLAAVIAPQFTGFLDKADEAQALTDGKAIATAIDALIAEDDYDIATSEGDIEELSGIDDLDTTAGSGNLTLEADGGFEYTVDGITVERSAQGSVTVQ